MVYRKKSEIEIREARLKKQLKQIDEQIDNVFDKAKGYIEKDETNKAQQAQTSWAILVDKRKIIANDLEKLSEMAPSEDLTLKFEEETAELFYKWLEKRSINFLRYCLLIKEEPEVLKRISKIGGEEISVEEIKKLKEICMKNQKREITANDFKKLKVRKDEK